MAHAPEPVITMMSRDATQEGTGGSGEEGRTGPSSSPAEEAVVPVIQEELDLHKHVVETGRIRVTKRVHEREEQVAVPLMHEEYEVDRVPIGRLLDAPASIRHEGDTLIVPVVEEVVVVEKRLRLKEELHIRKRRTESRTLQRVRLRQEEAIVERISSHPDRGSPANAVRDHRADAVPGPRKSGMDDEPGQRQPETTEEAWRRQAKP